MNALNCLIFTWNHLSHDIYPARVKWLERSLFKPSKFLKPFCLWKWSRVKKIEDHHIIYWPIIYFFLHVWIWSYGSSGWWQLLPLISLLTTMRITVRREQKIGLCLCLKWCAVGYWKSFLTTCYIYVSLILLMKSNDFGEAFLQSIFAIHSKSCQKWIQLFALK